MSSVNYLNIPKSFGIAAINSGNLIYQAVKAKDPGAQLEYDPSGKCIAVKNLAEVTIQELGEILYSKELAPKYDGWYPKVEDRKGSDRIFVIEFSCFPRGQVLQDLEPDSYSMKLGFPGCLPWCDVLEAQVKRVLERTRNGDVV